MARGDDLAARNIAYEINLLQTLNQIRRESHDHSPITDEGGLAVGVDEVHELIVDAAILLAVSEVTIASSSKFMTGFVMTSTTGRAAIVLNIIEIFDLGIGAGA